MNDEDFMKSIGWASDEDARQAREAASVPAPFDYSTAPAPFGGQDNNNATPSSDHAFAPRGSRGSSSSSSSSSYGHNQPRPAQPSQAPFDPHGNLSTLPPFKVARDL
jgi:hypothetical protein